MWRNGSARFERPLDLIGPSPHLLLGDELLDVPFLVRQLGLPRHVVGFGIIRRRPVSQGDQIRLEGFGVRYNAPFAQRNVKGGNLVAINDRGDGECQVDFGIVALGGVRPSAAAAAATRTTCTRTRRRQGKRMKQSQTGRPFGVGRIAGVMTGPLQPIPRRVGGNNGQRHVATGNSGSGKRWWCWCGWFWYIICSVVILVIVVIVIIHALGSPNNVGFVDCPGRRRCWFPGQERCSGLCRGEANNNHHHHHHHHHVPRTSESSGPLFPHGGHGSWVDDPQQKNTRLTVGNENGCLGKNPPNGWLLLLMGAPTPPSSTLVGCMYRYSGRIATTSELPRVAALEQTNDFCFLFWPAPPLAIMRFSS
mmetsp:Transcript_18798/g.40455  ORF Transcript_18798/g.40455 Transcript_18798/m.40455 type:complete len:364 (+) Transcript_18798:1636-2727(+)